MNSVLVEAGCLLARWQIRHQFTHAKQRVLPEPQQLAQGL